MFNPDGKKIMDKDKNIMDYLILNGALQIAGVDSETGQFLYQFTPKLKEVMPALYHEHLNYVNSELMILWEKGYVNIDLASDNPIVTLSEKAFDQQEISKLSKDEQWSINEIKRVISSQEL